MGCLSVIIAICGFALMIGVTLVAVPVVGLILLIISICTKKTIYPSKMVCPNCGSTDIFITSKRMGETTNGAASAAFGSGIGVAGFSRDKTYKYQREGVCRRCGFNYLYITPEDAKRVNTWQKDKILFSTVILLVGLVLNVGFFKDEIDMFFASENHTKSVWALSPNPIEDFDYYLDGDTIHLRSYQGLSKKIRIAMTYTVDGKTYTNDGKLAYTICSKTNPTSVILPEGITEIDDSFFEDGVEYIFLPKSLHPKDNDFLKFIRDVKVIYYGGSEEDWAILSNGIDRGDIDTVKIEYNVSVDDLQ